VVSASAENPRLAERSRLGADRPALAWPRAATWAVAGLTVLALALRLAMIHQSLFGDELTMYAIVHGHSFGYMFPVIHNTENTPPLFFMVVWFFAHGSEAAVLVRVPSLLASLATIPLIYWLALLTFDWAAGVVGAAWFAISPFALFYGTEARAYAAVAALVVLSTVALLTALEHRRFRWWALYVVAAVAAIYTHYIAALILIPQAVWALVTHRESIREQLIAGAVIVVAWLPWLPSFRVQAHHSAMEGARGSALTPVTLSNVFQVTGRTLIGHPFVALRHLPGIVPMVLLSALLLGLLAALVLSRRGAFGGWWRGLATPGGLVLVLALAPPALIILYSLRPHTSFLVARNLTVAVPYALLLFGRLLTFPRGWAAAAVSAVALALVAVGTVDLKSPENQRTDARGAANFVDSRAPPTAPVVVFEFPFGGPPGRAISAYLNRPQRIWQASQIQTAWAAAARTHSPVFVSGVPALRAFLMPPARYAPYYRLGAQFTSRGLLPLLTSEYVWR
jgi:mannosyltransferase